ncbi:MAG TPA: hypothetical protein VFL97_06455, partial [Nitrococcus sp.]|nr:hypothetical protein [Nitrococcus sp.]
MIPDPKRRHRLQFLVRVISRERAHLARTDARLFAEPFTVQRAQQLDENFDEAERVEAFVSRFGRLQDTLGDKLLPVYLEALGEKAGAVIDNLDRAERLDLIPSADDWFAIRKLRNQMVHEYIEDPAILANALQIGHEFVPTLLRVADTLMAALEERGWS